MRGNKTSTGESQLLLRVASRHLRYVLSDTNLDLPSRNSSVNRLYNFYTKVFGNLGMNSAINSWNEVFEVETHRLNTDKTYALRDILSVLEIKDNTTLFDIFERSGADIFCHKNHGKADFVVDENNVERIIDYLRVNHPLDLGGIAR